MNPRLQPINILSNPRPVDLRQLETLAAADASLSQTATPISVSYGDGIGPEIMDASLRILLAAGANIAVEPIEIGERLFRAGNSAGIDQKAWDALRSCKVLYKGPVTTPQGGGFKSPNVTIRKSFGLFANVRPCTSYHPFVSTRHPGMDVVIIRENEEDLYAGNEHRQTEKVYQCLKINSRPRCERIVCYAFEYALANDRHKVVCFTKDNIMKLTDGLFHRVFNEVGRDYPQIEQQHFIVDAGAAQIADNPYQFDVIVMPNLYGDILSDVGAEFAGSIGLAPSANIGADFAMFEAIHGSAPQLAGRDVANPSGLLMAGVMMLVHIGQSKVAQKVHNAWLSTIEDGVHTFDMNSQGVSKKQTGTAAFTDAVIERLGRIPARLKPAQYEIGSVMTKPRIALHTSTPTIVAKKILVGLDVFVHWSGNDPDLLATSVKRAQTAILELSMITNRGVKVWPQGVGEALKTDHWRCRFMVKPGHHLMKRAIVELQMRLVHLGVDFIKTEHLYNFDGEPGYSL